MIGSLITTTLTVYATAFVLKKTGLTFDHMVVPVKKSVKWLTKEAQSITGKVRKQEQTELLEQSSQISKNDEFDFNSKQ